MDGYNIVAQAIIIYNKRFTYMFISLPDIVNDSKALKMSTLYNYAQCCGFFNIPKA